jgi:hypothetical protein
MTLWLLEGLPGAGKSTMAERLCTLAKKAGYDAIWYLEESGDHPVHSKSLKETRRDAGLFVETCLDAWSQFVTKCRTDGVVHILEGSAFQSTVRFMMEDRLMAIDDYYRRYEEIVAPLNPRMVYLRSRNPLQHSAHTCGFRGKVWTEKVSGYLEKTKYSKYEGLTGLSGMHRFWADYAALCEKLVSVSKMPVKTIEIVPGDWERHMSEAAEFFDLANYGGAENAPRFNTAFDTGTSSSGSI